jgi:N-formylmaleamate deformylase
MMDNRYLKTSALADLADVTAQSRWFRSGGLRLHALDYGGDGVPIIILPGITSPAITMDFIARQLTDIGRPVVLDLRGRGLSDEASSYTIDDYADDVEAVVSEFSLARPLLLGHSMGARVAAATAVREHNELAGLILVDPPLSGPGRDPYPTTLDAFRTQLAQARRGTDADEVAQAWPRWPRREQELRARWLSSCGEDAVVRSHQSFETENFFDYWVQLKSHAVLMYGGQSPVVTAAGAAELAAANPGVQMVEVLDAGHMIFWDQPHTSLTALRDLIRLASARDKHRLRLRHTALHTSTSERHGTHVMPR